jgi:hypothetical protein
MVILPHRRKAFRTQSGPTTNGLIGYWNFNEGTGATTADTSSSNFNGTLANGPSWVTGKFNNALSFDGSNDYVTVPHNTALNFSQISLFSIMAWIKTTQTNYGFIIAKALNEGTYAGYYLHTYLGKLHSTLQTTTSNYRLIRAETTTVNDGNWHHVAWCNDANSPAGHKMYIDGVLQTTTTLQDNLFGTVSTTVPLNFGARNAGGVPFAGAIDDVRVYNRALNATEIRIIASQ